MLKSEKIIILAPWGAIGAAGWTHGGPESEFERFGNDLGTPF